MRIKEHLKHWAKCEFGSIKLKKLSLLREIENLDVTRESRPLSTLESTTEANLKGELGLILKLEEVYWKQRARVTWLKEGDDNTSFFHAVANGRRNKNFIPWVLKDNFKVTNNKGIGEAFTSLYQNLYSSTQTHRHQIVWGELLGSKANHNLSNLDDPFTQEEIKAAVFGMPAEKAPGPDGLSLFFFQKFWDIVKDDIFRLCDDFLWGRVNLERIN